MLKRNKIILFVVVLLIIGISVFYGHKKSGMFIDEIYSYGLSNSHYNPFVKSLKGDNMIDKVYTSQEFYDYISLDENEGFDFGSVYYNQTKDVHPPLYYWLLNISQSLWGNGFTKWSGLCLNIVLYVLVIVLLYKLCEKLFNNERIAIISIVLYGLSYIGLSTMLMIRMYMLMALFTVSLAYLIVLYLKNKNKWICMLIGLNVFLGLMTQYYFVIYAFFVCLAVDIFFIYKKEYKYMLVFSITSLLGVIGMVLVYPACINHLTAEKLVSGGTVIKNLMMFSTYIGKIARYTWNVVRHTLIPVLIGIMASALVILKMKKVVSYVKEEKLDLTAIIIIIPAFLALIVIAVISPINSMRYIYNIMPIFMVLIGMMLYICLNCYGNTMLLRHMKRVSLVMATVLSVAMLLKIEPEYIYKEHNEYNQLVKSYRKYPCIYMNDNYHATVTQDLLQLMYFEDVLVTNDPTSEKIKQYIGTYSNVENVIVYIDISEFWSSGFVPEEMLDTLADEMGFSRYKLLYQYGLSATYVLTNE